jgi:hypothetical protein
VLFLKRKIPIEDFVRELAPVAIPRSMSFFQRENRNAQNHLSLAEPVLSDLTAGLLLFFISEHLPDDKRTSGEMMARAYKTMRKVLTPLGGSGDRAHTWWKAFSDGRIFHKDMELPVIACRVIWQKLFPDTPYRKDSALPALTYFVQVEAGSAKSVKLV